METYIPQTTKIPLNPKSRHTSGSRQLKRMIDNRTETTQQKRLLDTINAGQQVIQCKDGELCREVKEDNAMIAPDRNFTSKHVRNPINNTDAIRTHACREEPTKINTLLDDSTLNLANIEFESDLPPTSDSTPYHDTELVKTTCNIQETELKKVESIDAGYFDLVEPKPIIPRQVEASNWNEFETKGIVVTNIETFDINIIAPDLITEYNRVKLLRQTKSQEKDKRKRNKANADIDHQLETIKQDIQTRIEEHLNQRAKAEQEAQNTQYIADQQTWADKVKEKFSRIGNKNLKDTTYTTPSEIDSIPIIGSKEILIGIGKNSDENIFAFHYKGHK